MKILLTITVLIVTSSLLQGQEVCEKNDPKKHPTLTNKTYVDKITGRPINFYLNHRDIDSPAKLFLYDDEETFGFLDSALTKNAETRPFYLFISIRSLTEVSVQKLFQNPTHFSLIFVK